MSQPLDLVLDHQLAALQLANMQVVYGGVHECFVQFVLENFVLAFQFDQMRLYCHYELPRWVKPQIRSGLLSVHEWKELSMGDAKCRSQVFNLICNQS
ncbi:hypothetical protein UP10_26935 [Bradyrhizobium sp. LTSPM299]|nr:hypothetical protein UP10_26935 [Bradyrhizobium sp. LTSPM299]